MALSALLRWRWTSFRPSLVAVAASLSAAQPAFAVDQQTLSRLLQPADMALVMVNICTALGHPFPPDLHGQHGTLPEYARHMKDRVSAGLTPEQIGAVLQQSADAAKSAALEEVRSLTVLDESGARARMRDWCATRVKPLLETFMRTYDEHPDQFEKQVAGAKSESN